MLMLKSRLDPGSFEAQWMRAARRRGLGPARHPPLDFRDFTFLGALPKDASLRDLRVFPGRNSYWVLILYGFRTRSGSGALLLRSRVPSRAGEQAPGFNPKGFPVAAAFLRAFDLLVRTAKGWPGLYQYRSPWSLAFTLDWLRGQLPGRGFSLQQRFTGKDGLVVWRLAKGPRNLMLCARPDAGKDAWQNGCTFSLVTDLPPDGWVGP